MSTTDLNTIAENLAELLTTVTSQTSAFYNLFLSTTPQDVTFLAFDANNQLVEVTIPNRAKDRQIATSGNGSPEGVVTGNVGEVYVDQQYNQIYYKISGTGNTGWTLALTQASVEALLQGYVPKTRTVNNKMLNENITLTASDINAMASTEKLGKSLEISGINLTLKDQDGVALSSVPIVTTGANKDLSNLTTTGEAHFADPQLSNLDSTGNAKIVPSQTGNSGKFLTTNGTSASWGTPSPHNLFDCKWCDYTLSDLSWVNSSTFSWQNGTTYSTAYNHLVSDISGITSETETIGSYTVTFYRATDGHKICLANQETTVNNIYTESGIAWYYILDTTNTRFKLPRTKWGFEGLRDNVGDYVSESLPNITGSFMPHSNSSGAYASFGTGSIYNGAFGSTDYGTTGGNIQNTSGNYARYLTTFNASNSSSTYQDNAPVQERATQMYLYFYVGEYTQTAIEQTAGLNASLFNAKADLSLSNSTSPVVTAPYLKTSYVSGTSGYRIWDDGYCEQWGTISTTTDYFTPTITLMKTFINNMYFISFTGGYTGNAGYTPNISSKTTTNFIISNALNKTGFASWKACGYLASGQY